jgi:predicted MFS family arabinose efflux permease
VPALAYCASVDATKSRSLVRVALIATFLIVVGQYASFTYVLPFLEQVSQMLVEGSSLTLLAYGVAGFFGNIAGSAMIAQGPQTGIIFAASLLTANTAVFVVAGMAAAVAVAVGVTALAEGS